MVCILIAILSMVALSDIHIFSFHLSQNPDPDRDLALRVTI
jgi:hypothetical protein